jgi:hypothetical protein
MEPNNNPREPQRQDQGGFPSGGSHALIPGLILVGIGALFLLGNLGLIHANSWFEYWPVILIAVGLVKLVDSNYPGGRVIGAVVLGVGGAILADNLGYINVANLWPLILIGVGLFMIWNRTTGREEGFWGSRPYPNWGWAHRGWARRDWAHRGWGSGQPWSSSSSYGPNMVNEFAMFGVSRRVVTNPDFQGGHINCIFGGVNLDLTGANMTGATAVLHVSALYGGISVRVPTSWDVEVRGTGLFGSFVDHTVHPPSSPDTKRLIVRGGAIFGGVTIKN